MSNALRAMAVNPLGGLVTTYERLDQRRALAVGIALSLVFDACFALGLYVAVKQTPELSVWLPAGGRSLKLLLLGAVLVVSVAASCALARKVFHGNGSFEGDVFTAGAALLPVGLAILVSSVLGSLNVEVVIAVAVFALCYSILMLHAGCVSIGKVSEPGAALAVPIVLLFSAWLVKIIVTAMISR